MTYTMADTIIERGINAMRSGNPNEARSMFEAVLSRDEQNIKAWWWLAQTCEAPKDRSKCLEKARQSASKDEEGLTVYRTLLERSKVKALPLFKVAAKSASKGNRCPICSLSLAEGDTIVVCNSCKQAHHSECWRYNAYHCGNYACSNDALIDNNAPITTEPPKKETLIAVKEEEIPTESPWISREKQEAGFKNKLRNMAVNAMAQSFFRQLVQADQMRRRKQAQEQLQAQIQQTIIKEMVKVFFIGLIPGILLGISAFKYTHSWSIAVITGFLIAAGLSHAASLTMKSQEHFIGIIYALLPKILAGTALITLFSLWGVLLWPVLIAAAAGVISTLILHIPAVYARRTPIVYILATLLLLALRALKIF